MSLSSRTDDDADPELEHLLSRARAADPAAEGAVYERFQRFVERRVGEARTRRNWFWLEDLEGAVQEVFAQFFRALREGKFEWKGRRAFEGFLLRTAFFVVMNMKGKAGDARAVSLHDAEGALRFDVASFAEAVYDDLERQECLRLLARAVGSLNANRREVVERTLLGQKVRDICAATGRSPASVSGLKFNALVQLRAKLEELGFSARCGDLFQLGDGVEVSGG